ncbi:toxin-antitoxin system YwqK family antitoxin [Magnetococcus sp. PR-3]|uniref:toxin-antitoxin system YwqK family antitoxin n=1 Tax=Magnetococcus sp. PR-3 TaxID=3120355 RepID=UPI002FCE63AF
MLLTRVKTKHKRALLVMSLGLMLAACGPTEFSDLELRKGRAYLKGSLAPYSGPVVAFYPAKEEGADRKIYMEGLYANGLRDGTWTTYRTNGSKIEDKYVFGRRNGQIKRFDSRGKVRSEESYFNGRRHGGAVYYKKDGKVARNLYYQEGNVRAYPNPARRAQIEAKMKEGPSDDLLHIK